VTALVTEQESLVNHSSDGSLAGSLVLLLLVIRILQTVFGAWSILGSSIPLLSGRELLGDGFSLNVNGSKR
jgi:hypothetical protein